jgi:DNA mismatch repair enzyme MutH
LIGKIGGSTDHARELSMEYVTRKGSSGVFMEWMITGRRGDNCSTPDDGVVEVKTISVKKSTHRRSKYDLGTGYTVKENLRLTKLNPQEIQYIPYEHSGLYHKSVMLIALIEYNRRTPLMESKFLGFAFLDLRPYHDSIKQDYEAVAQACREGKAHTFRSSHEQICKTIKLYSNGQGTNTGSYYDRDGVACIAKNKSFYVFKDNLVRWLDVI